jgi:hypothetical protein
MMPCRLGTPPLTFSEDRRYANMLITFDTGLRTFSSTKSCPQAPSEELPSGLVCLGPSELEPEALRRPSFRFLVNITNIQHQQQCWLLRLQRHYLVSTT